jgi:HEAT repeat protein
LQAAVRCLDDADPVVRRTAAWALGRAGGANRRRALLRSRAVERDPTVTAEIDAALERI